MSLSIGDPANGQRVVFARPDGTVVIVSPAAPRPEGISEDDYMRYIALHAQGVAGLSGEQWAQDATRIADHHVSAIPTKWRQRTRIDDDGMPTEIVPSAIRWNGAELTVHLPTAKQQILLDAQVEAEKQKLPAKVKDAAIAELAAQIGTHSLTQLEQVNVKEFIKSKKQ